MTDIISGSSSVLKILSNLFAPHESKYRLVHYLLFERCSEGHLVFNVITGELILVSIDEYKTLVQSNEFSLQEVNSSELLQELLNRWFLIPVCFDEFVLTKQIRSALKLMQTTSKITTYTILPTTSCNARCFYCFEAGLPQHTMELCTADHVVNFILNNYKGNPILIRWFGGEPLLGTSIINYICSKLEFASVSFSSRIVTNGYLFTDSLIKQSVQKWHLGQAMITLDDLEERYNTIKNYTNINGQQGNPFQIVIKNIRLLLEMSVFVEIRLNIDCHNIEYMDDLIDVIYKNFKQFDNFHVFTVILHSNGKTAVPHTLDVMDHLYKKQRIIEQRLYLLGIGRKEYTHLPALRVNACMADSFQNIVINPLGQLAKCDASIYEGLVGSVDEGVADCSYWMGTKTEDMDCTLCPIFPSCATLEHCNAYLSCNTVEQSHKIQSRKDSMLRTWDCYVKKER